MNFQGRHLVISKNPLRGFPVLEAVGFEPMAMRQIKKSGLQLQL